MLRTQLGNVYNRLHRHRNQRHQDAFAMKSKRRHGDCRSATAAPATARDGDTDQQEQASITRVAVTQTATTASASENDEKSQQQQPGQVHQSASVRRARAYFEFSSSGHKSPHSDSSCTLASMSTDLTVNNNNNDTNVVVVDVVDLSNDDDATIVVDGQRRDDESTEDDESVQQQRMMFVVSPSLSWSMSVWSLDVGRDEQEEIADYGDRDAQLMQKSRQLQDEKLLSSIDSFSVGAGEMSRRQLTTTDADTSRDADSSHSSLSLEHHQPPEVATDSESEEVRRRPVQQVLSTTNDMFGGGECERHARTWKWAKCSANAAAAVAAAGSARTPGDRRDLLLLSYFRSLSQINVEGLEWDLI